MIYILKLEDKKYYIGYSENNKTCDIRIKKHFEGNGSKWTKKYKPIEIIEKKDGDMFDEEKYTLIYIDEYGIDNVRGGSYTKVKLSQNDKEKATQTARSVLNKCFICGSTEHYSQSCEKITSKKKKKNSSQKKVYKEEEEYYPCGLCGDSPFGMYGGEGIYIPCPGCGDI